MDFVRQFWDKSNTAKFDKFNKFEGIFPIKLLLFNNIFEIKEHWLNAVGTYPLMELYDKSKLFKLISLPIDVGKEPDREIDDNVRDDKDVR